MTGEYKDSVKREFRTMRDLGLINYLPYPFDPKKKYNLSSNYRFSCGKKKTTYLNLYKMFNDALLKAKTPEQTESESYKIREMLDKHAKTI